MLVKDFIKMDMHGSIFQLVDASLVGYITYPHIIESVDRNVARERYGEYKVVGFAPHSKHAVKLYVTQ